MDNVYVRLMDMPAAVKGFAALDPDGNYNVYINMNLSQEQQMAALAHEVVHIDNPHLRVNMPFWLCEREIK